MCVQCCIIYDTEGLAQGLLETQMQMLNSGQRLVTRWSSQWFRTLILLFLDHSLKENPKSKNSFRTCESQFEKHYLSLFRVVSDLKKNSPGKQKALGNLL